MEKKLPAIPAKRYFTIGEVSDLCGVKPYVLRYWEQEFTQLKPVKRRGNRRYYQHHEVLLIRRIRDLLYDQGFTISGARNRLLEFEHAARREHTAALPDDGVPGGAAASADGARADAGQPNDRAADDHAAKLQSSSAVMRYTPIQVRAELVSIRALLDV